MRARAMAKFDVIDLVVRDRTRADRARELYEQLAALGLQFDLARAQSLLDARAAWKKRSLGVSAEPTGESSELESVLAPPLEQAKALFARYATLMLEVRAVLTRAEYEKLNGLR
jgi:hypothetical protein